MRKIKLFLVIWNSLVVFSTSLLALYLPYNLVFAVPEDSIYLYLSVFVNLIFILDTLISFYSSHKGNDYEGFEGGTASRYYLKKWFVFDVLAAIPYYLLFPGSYIQLIAMIKLVKVANLMWHMRQREILYNNLLSLVFFFFWAVHLSHWLSCTWIFLRGVNPDYDYITNYIKALFWTAQTLTTVGYGDVTPQNNVQTLFNIVVMVMGVGFYGYLIGNIAGILSKKDPAKAQYLENLEKLSALLHFRKIPFDLQTRIRNYYEYMWRQRLGYDESSFLYNLPKGLSDEVSLWLKKEVIENIPLFRGTTRDFIKEIALVLKPIILTPGDIVFSEGDPGEEMYFIQRGKLTVISRNSKIAELSDGQFFGEIALFKNIPRTAAVQAMSYCDLYCLRKDAFDDVLSKHPEIMSRIIAEMQVRENENVFSVK